MAANRIRSLGNVDYNNVLFSDVEFSEDITGFCAGQQANHTTIFMARSSLLFLWMLIATLLGPCGLPQVEAQVTSSTATETLRAELANLDDTSYANRESATEQLSQQPDLAIPLIVETLLQSSPTQQQVLPEASLRMLRLLSTWASDPDRSPGKEAILGLQKLARGASTVTAIRAQNLLTELTLEHSVEVTQRLRRQGVFIGRDSIQIVTAQAIDRYLMRLDDSYRGSPEALESLRWLVDVDMVHARGKLITSDVLKSIVSLPNLRVLQLRDVELTLADVESLANIRNLDTLEFIYTRLDAAAIPVLADLPVSRSLRLFGTDLDPKTLDALGEQLEGVEFVHGRGGFLGIMADQPNSNVIGNVLAASGAALADLRREDRIISINEAPITKFDELRNELAKYAANETVRVTFERPTVQLSDTGKLETTWVQMTADVTLGMQE